jgi:4-amino-4-deoxy-L-arabinose transferase-like glycosyltransferase
MARRCLISSAKLNLFMPPASERSAVPFASQPSVVSTPEIAPRGDILVLAVLTLAGAGLRLFHLGAKSLWQDEPAMVAIARMSLPHFVRVWWYGEASFQSVYFLLMRGWIHLGSSEAWIRLPAALFGIAAIPLIYLVARKLVGSRPALASAALLAFSSTHVYYSQEARTYTMTILLVLLSSWFFVQAVEQGREKDWIAWTIFSVLAVYGHYFASLVMVAQACSLFLCKKPAPWKRMVLHALLILAMAMPGMTYVFRTSPEFLTGALNVKPTPKQLLHLALFLGGSGEKLVLATILWAAGVRAIWRERLGRAEAEIFWRGMLVLLWAVLPIFLVAVVSLHYPVFVQRYMIFSLPAALMLAGRGMSALPKRNLGRWLVVVLCAASMVNIVLGYRKPREDWRGATDSIIRSAAPGDALLIYPFYARPGFDYYYDLRRENAPALRVFTPPFYGFGEDDQSFLRALSSNPAQFRHVWVMVRQAGPDWGDQRGEHRAVAAQLQAVFGTPVTRQFQDITLLEFGH